MNHTHKPRVLVLDGDMVPALTICRSLARRKCEVHVGSHVDSPIAGYSRFRSARYRYPDPLTETAEFLTWLSAHTREAQYDLVIPVTERTLTPLSHNRDDFAHVRVAMPGAESLDLVLDKSKTMVLAEKLGVPIPKSVFVESQEQLASLRKGLNYPVVIKPSRSIGTKDGDASQLQVGYAFDANGLDTRCTHALRFGSLLLQEYFGGVGVGIELIASNGEIAYAFQHRRIHEVPLTGGGSSLRKSEAVDPQLLDASKRLIKALNWSGVAMVEFKLDPQSGEFCLMEINGRFWGSLPLAVVAGADFPAMLLDLELSGEITPLPLYREEVYCRLLTRDIWWYEAVLRGDADARLVRIPTRAEVFRELRLFFKLRHRFDVQSLLDPLPGLVDIRNIAASYIQRLSAIFEHYSFRIEQLKIWKSGHVASKIATASSLLFVCYGNINRSALADVMIRAYAEDTGVAVHSAGFHPEDGRTPDPVMTQIAESHGVDLGSLRSTTVSEAMLRNSDIIFVMEKSHYDQVIGSCPDVRERVFLLGAHPGTGAGAAEITDPYGQPRQAYVRCYDRVSGAIDHLKSLLAERTGD